MFARCRNYLVLWVLHITDILAQSVQSVEGVSNGDCELERLTRTLFVL